METKKITRELLFLVLHSAPFIYLALVYASLPDIVPTHFGISGEADGFSSKQSLIWMLLALNVLGYLLFLLIPLIDPKKFAADHRKIYLRIRIGMALLLVSLSVLLVYLANGDPQKGIFALGVLFSLLCIFLGNYMQAVKPNYFIGIRTPWTLEHEIIWRKTHLVTGRILFWGGAGSIPFLFLMPSNLAPVAPVFVLIGGCFWGILYSYMLYRKQKKETN